MQRDIALRRIDAVVVLACLIVGVGSHDERFAGPFRVGMLTIDFLEFLDRLLGILLRVEEIEALVVEPVGGCIRGHVLLLGEHVETAAGGKAAYQKSDRANTGNRHPSSRSYRWAGGLSINSA